MKTLAIVVTAAAAGAAAVLGWPSLRAALDPAAPLVAACERELLARLAAPGDYARRQVTALTPTPVGPDEAAGDGAAPEVLEAYRDHDRWWRHGAVIEYRTGALAGTALCEYFTLTPEPPADPPGPLVRIDGLTTLEWTARAAAR